MSSRRPDPLTAEERALADRLGRVAPRVGPSPQLDAAILAAARRPRVRPRAPGPRWPAIVGLAASLALAVGIGWQLRPQPEPVAAEAPWEARPAAAPLDTTSDQVRLRHQAPPMAPVAIEQAEQRPQAGQAGQADHARREAATPRVTVEPAPQAPAIMRAKAAPASPATRSAAAAASPAGDPLTPSASAPSRAPAAPAAPAVITAPVGAAVVPAAASRAPLQSPPAPGNGPARRTATRASSRTADANASAQAKQMASTAQPPIVFDDPMPSTPAAIGVDAWPVEQDRQLPLDAWFERIRQRRDGGDPTGARASLDLLRHAHPDASLPEDLRVWAAEAPPATSARDETGPVNPR